MSSRWGLFHDGVATGISGQVPGKVSVYIEILYLREMFESEGSGFVIELEDCTHFEYQPLGRANPARTEIYCGLRA